MPERERKREVNLRLKMELVKKGLTQREFIARLPLKMYENRFSDICLGWVRPRPEERQAIAQALGKPESYLFRYVDREIEQEQEALKAAPELIS